MSHSDNKSPNVLLQSLCCQILGKSESEIGHQFQYAVRVIGSSFTPTVERDEFLVAEKIKKELAKQKREVDAALFSELHRKLQTQAVLRNRWAALYLLLSLAENPRKPHAKLLSGSTLFGNGLPLLVHSTPAPRPQSLPLPLLEVACGAGQAGGMVPCPGLQQQQQRQQRQRGGLASSASFGSSGVSSVTPSGMRGPTPTPDSLYPGQSHRTPADGTARQAWASQSGPYGLVARSDAHGARSEGDVNTSVELSESLLVRDLLYVFQGIEGTYVRLSQTEGAYLIDPKVGAPKSLRDVTARLSEIGWLHNKARKYIDQRALDRAFGLVGQSFCAALHQELKEFYRLISVLHSQLNVEEDLGVNVGPEGSLTLRRLLVWTSEPRQRLHSLAALVDRCHGRKGGELASCVHAYTRSGSPCVRSLARHLLGLVSLPLHTMLSRWIYDGELEDTFHEFFVAADPAVKAERLWHDKYSMRKSMIPSFISSEQAQKVLSIGKSINFLHQVCQDRTLSTRPRPTSQLKEQRHGLTAGDGDIEWEWSQLQIDTVYARTSHHLLDTLNSRYHLMEHMQAMRRYLLLGQGDFVRHLMDLLKPELARPANTLYQHNLTGILETSVRATNAQFDSPDILNRVDVRLLEVSPGDTGWDVFSLDYHVDGPIATVFTQECMMQYLRVFNFLWRAKRMEYSLTDIWKGQMCHSKLLRSMPELSGVLQQSYVLASEMMHFIHQMQYYITFEVLECSWDRLLTQVRAAPALDHVIAAHQEFLSSCVSRCLLDADSRLMLAQLRAIFDQIVQFQAAQEGMQRAALQELQLRLQRQEEVAARQRAGEWGTTEARELHEEQRISEFRSHFVPKTRSQLRVLTQSYQDIVQQFLVMLTRSSDESLRFLSFRLDFNEHYRARNPHLRLSLGSARSQRRAPPH
ncbi:gamma-tubulin complex component 3 [Petromyzon marinus]|uniref:gamma-tubulin complex component 3 n=1 Tax=Petromyzon marinus TaxID=7757 RepID=UPI003F6EC197